MKIGVCLSNEIEPEIGGGYSYIMTLLEELFHANGKSLVLILEQRIPKDTSKLSAFLSGSKIISFNPLVSSPSFLLRAIGKIGRILNIKLMIAFSEKSLAKNSASVDKINENTFLSIVKKNNIDLVYYPEPCVCFNTDIPFCTTVWDLGHLINPEFPEFSSKFNYRDSLYRKLLPKAHKIFSESEAGKENINKYYSIAREKIKTIPLFPAKSINIQVDEKETEEWLKNKNLKKNEYLFYPAQFWSHKNHIGLLKAFSYISKNSPSLILVLTGSDQGNLSYIKQKIREFGLSKNVFYFGFVSEKEIKILYKNALSLVMPTFLGPTNMPILEAMAIGCPVICSDFQGHREIAHDAALYFDPASPTDIAEKINTLIGNDMVRQQLIQNAKKLHDTKTNSVENARANLVESFLEFSKVRNA